MLKDSHQESGTYFSNFSLAMNSFYGIISANNKFRIYSKARRFQILKCTGEVTRTFFWNLVKKMEIESFIECGANDAIVSREFLSYMPYGGAIAIEANPKVFERFKAINKEISKLKYLNLGVSDKRETLNFYVPNVTDESISIFGSFQKLSIYDYYPPREVQTLPLDEILKTELKTSENIALWIDVEGQFGKLIDGATKTLKSPKCKILYCEVQDDEYYLQELNAQQIVEKLWGYGFVPFARDFFTQPLYNLIFVKRDVLQKINQERAIYLSELMEIKIPYFLLPDWKSGLSKFKRTLLKVGGKRSKRVIHKISRVLGSESSRNIRSGK